MQIRPGRPQDAATIAEIYVCSWQQAFAGIVPQSYLDSMDVHRETLGWRSLLREARWPKEGVLLAEGDQGASAFAGFGPAEDSPGTAMLGTLYALPSSWGTGTGRRLMIATQETLRQAGYQAATLWVLEANTRARRFYEAAGWRPDGTLVQDVASGMVLPKLRYHRSLGEDSPGAFPPNPSREAVRHHHDRAVDAQTPSRATPRLPRRAGAAPTS